MSFFLSVRPTNKSKSQGCSFNASVLRETVEGARDALEPSAFFSQNSSRKPANGIHSPSQPTLESPKCTAPEAMCKTGSLWKTGSSEKT